MSKAFQDAVTEFIFLKDQPAQSDIIMIPGSNHPDHVILAAKLYAKGYASLILPSGKYALSKNSCSIPGFDTEWSWMKSILTSHHVPENAILKEDQAQYTWENALRSREVTKRAGIVVRRAILCCRPFHARRVLFYYQAAFPDTEFLVCPCREPGLDRDDWHLTEDGRGRILGEVRRMGDQINEVWEDQLLHTHEREG